MQYGVLNMIRWIQIGANPKAVITESYQNHVANLHHLCALFELCRNTTCNINMYIQCVVYASKNTVLLTEVIKQAQFAKIHYAKIYSGDWIFRYDAFGCWERSIDIDHSSTNVKPHLTTGFSAPVLK